MKGIVFNLLEEVVRRARGEDAWDALLDRARLTGSFTSLGSYPDDDLSRLVAAASGSFDMPPDAVLRWFGRRAMPLLAGRYPGFFTTQPSTRTFLLTLNDIIHPEVRKLYPGAHVPVFDFEDSAPDALVMGYQSNRALCSLAEGFIEGAADWYGETVGITQVKCLHRGDEKCVFELRFSQAKG